MLNALLDCGVNLDSKLLGIASIGDIPLTWRVLSNVDHASLAGDDGANLLHHFVSQRQFDLAQHLLSNGVSADAQSAAGTALYRAVDAKDIEGIEFLLRAGADVNATIRTAPGYYRQASSALGHAVYLEYAKVVELLLDHGADILRRLTDSLLPTGQPSVPGTSFGFWKSTWTLGRHDSCLGTWWTLQTAALLLSQPILPGILEGQQHINSSEPWKYQSNASTLWRPLLYSNTASTRTARPSQLDRS
jgi:hypothetical protein